MTNGFDKLTTDGIRDMLINDGIIDKLMPMAKSVSRYKLCHQSNPITLSLSKGFMWFDKLTTNGGQGSPRTEGKAHHERRAKLTTNGGQSSPRTGSRSS